MVNFTNHFTCLRIGHHVYQENTAAQRRQLWAGCMNHTRRMQRHNNHNRDRKHRRHGPYAGPDGRRQPERRPWLCKADPTHG